MDLRTALVSLLALLPIGACASSRHLEGATIWHVKAIRPDGSFVDVKAIDQDGRILDVKALETPGNLHVMDVKALREGERIDVKLLPGDGTSTSAPLRAITAEGRVLLIAALTANGSRLPVAGVRRDDNIYHVKAIGEHGELLGVKAISTDGHLMDVKGVVLDEDPPGTRIHGVPIAAHVKAIPQESDPAPGGERTWRVRAIHPDGFTFGVQAVDPAGATYGIEAIEVAGNRQLMDVKANRGGQRLAVKAMLEADGDTPIRAITPDGLVLDVRAALPGQPPLEVRAVRHSGNIYHVKAIGTDGRLYAIKALSPEGFLHDVKALKLTEVEIEGFEGDVPFHAHVKALPQVLGGDR